SGGPRGLQILQPGAKTIRGGFDSHTFPPVHGPANPLFALLLKVAAGLKGKEVVIRVLDRRFLFPDRWIVYASLVLSISLSGIIIPTPAGAFDLSRQAEILQRSLKDSLGVAAQEETRSMDLLKEMLDRETGEPRIEGTRWHREKNARVAMLSALLFPGLGQMYNEKPVKAVLAMGFEVFYLSRILHNYRLEKRELELRDRYPKYIESGGENPVLLLNYPWREHNAWVVEYRERQVDYIWWSAGCLLVIVLDAYIDSHLHDMNFRIESSPLGDSPGISLVIDF
ncbi:MAG: hypothetical protein JW814_08910, partial [Candidatus Krumholzibacteriota bacterium]|nr:hypothetical protein [Candidatus Krumholzibacteriota bacterium]